jgi:cation:H+ antiporter
MSAGFALILFAGSLVVTLSAARLFASRLDRLGVRFGFPEALIGLLTALAADGPEISSALFALARGAHTVGVGVLVGSNAFNLAAMIGVSALLAGAVVMRRRALALEGFVGCAITLIAAAVLLGWISPGAAAALAVAVLVPYLALVIGVEAIPSRVRRARVDPELVRDLAQRPRSATADPSERPTHHLLGLIVVDVALILIGSAGMVQAALALSDRWGISREVLGVLILAPLTSVPNAATALRLGRAGRGVALVSETFNSNTINLAAGVIVPALFVSFTALSATAKLQLGVLGAMTVATIALLSRRRGIGRVGGVVLVLLYAGFVMLQVGSP